MYEDSTSDNNKNLDEWGYVWGFHPCLHKRRLSIDVMSGDSTHVCTKED